MAADSSIFQAYLQPPKSVLEFGADMDKAEGNKIALAMQRMQMAEGADKMRATAEDRNAIRRAAQSSAGDRNAFIRALRGPGATAGTLAQADSLEKGGVELDKGRAAVEKDRAGTAKTQAETKYEALDRHARELFNVNTIEDVARYADDGIAAGLFDVAKREQIIAAAQQQGVAAWKAANLSKAVPILEKFKADAEMERAQLQADTSIQTTGMNNKTSLATNERTVAATLAGQARQAADAAAGRGVQMKIAGMADARSREANETGKALVNQKRTLEIEALQEKADQTRKGKDAAASSVSNQIAVIDKALKHPGRTTATGLSGTLDPRNYVPGTEATDFRAVLDQIGGAAFLQAFESLKGGGAITEIEGQKATSAIARLNRAQSDTEFETALRDLRQVMTTGYKRQTGQDYGGTAAPATAAPASVRGGPMQPKPKAGKDLGGGFTLN